jgi:hypothetical protein
MLQTLSFELTQDSRALHGKLLHQIQFAIFPEESPGVFGRASYFSFCEQLSKERSDLQEALDESKSECSAQAKEISSLEAKITELEEQAQHSEPKISKMLETIARLKTHNEQLQERNTQIRDGETDLLNQISILASELKLKDLQYFERASHSPDDLTYKAAAVKTESPKSAEVVVAHEDCTALDRSRVSCIGQLEEQIAKLKKSLECKDRQYKVMKKCYEADMKAFKECMNQRMNEQKIDQGPKTRNYLQRVKMDTSHYNELAQLTGQNINDMTFDEVVKLATVVVADSKVLVEKYKTRYDDVERIFLEQQLEKQEVMDQVAEIKARISYTELYVEDFAAAPVKTERLFVGLGRTLEVPRFLRTNGFVNNLNLSKKDVMTLVSELWTSKQQWQNKMKRAMPLPIYLYNFLRNKYNYQPKVIEYGYNLMETAERFSDEPDLEMFLLIVKNEFPEQLFYDCTRMIKFLKRYLVEVSTRYRTEAVPSLVLPTVMKCLQNYFPQKRPKDLEVLQDLLEREPVATGKTGAVYVIDSLLSEDSLEPSSFQQCIKKQYLMDLQRFYAELSSQLLKQGDTTNSAVSVLLLKQIYAQVDGNLTIEQATERLAPLLGTFLGEEKALVSIPSAVLKMKRMFLKPSQLYLSGE